MTQLWKNGMLKGRNTERVCRMEQNLKPGIYRHYKGGEYELIGIVTHSETLEKMVLYRALYGEKGFWVRPAHMWSETVEKDGIFMRRFTYIGEKDKKK